MSGGKTSSKTKQQSLVDPNAYQALYGQGATQAQFNKKGQVTAPATTGTGGIIPSAQNLYSQNPTGLNNTQTSALQAGVDYLTSPQAQAGANASQQVANTFLNQLSQSNGSAPQQQPVDIQSILGQYGGSNPVDLNAIRNGFQTDMSQLQGMMPQNVSGGGVAGLGINYQDAMQKALSGQVDNPYLHQMAQDAADVTTQNYLRNVAPAMRGAARQTGMYGSSRQGIAEGLAQSDLNNQILQAGTNLFGNAYESAQGRAANAASQLAGYDQQAKMMNAQLGQQAALANQSAALQAAGLMANYDLGQKGLGQNAASLAANYDLGQKGLGMQAANLAADYNLGLGGQALQNRALTSSNAIQGANLAQQASQIPFQNIQSLYGIGNTMQQAPWQQLGYLQNSLYPIANLGGTQVGTQTTSGGGNGMLGGLLSMGMGALGGMAGGMGGSVGGTPNSAVTGLTNSWQTPALNVYPW